VISDSTGCPMKIVRNAMNVEKSLIHLGGVITAGFVGRFSATDVAILRFQEN
jgi:hypothetical protein